jgi:hypothetical protein
MCDVLSKLLLCVFKKLPEIVSFKKSAKYVGVVGYRDGGSNMHSGLQFVIVSLSF